MEIEEVIVYIEDIHEYLMERYTEDNIPDEWFRALEEVEARL